MYNFMYFVMLLRKHMLSPIASGEFDTLARCQNRSCAYRSVNFTPFRALQCNSIGKILCIHFFVADFVVISYDISSPSD